MRRLFGALLALILLAPAAAARADALPPVRHAFVIVLENSDFDTNFPASGAPAAPYLARELTRRGQLLTQYFGTSHVSLGNYVSMVSGQAPNPDTQSDCLPQYRDVFPGVPAPDFDQVIGSGCVYPASVRTIADQLEAKGLTWRGYMEDMGADGARDNTIRNGVDVKACGHPAIGTTDGTQTATATDQYATRHDPFMYFHSIIDDQARCDAHVVNLDRLPADLASASTTPSFSFITPDLCSDGHDTGCKDGRPGGLTSADAFLRQWVPQITSSPAFADGGLLVITWDEGSAPQPSSSGSCCDEQSGYDTPMPGIVGPGGGRTGTVVLSPFTVPGSVNATPYNHYALLRSLEDLFGLAHLGYAAEPGLKGFGSDVFGQAATVDLTGSSAEQPAAAGDGTPEGAAPRAVVNPCRVVSVRGQGRRLRPGTLVSALSVERRRAHAPVLVVVASRRTRLTVRLGAYRADALTQACRPVRMPLPAQHGRARLSIALGGRIERRTVLF